MQITNRRIEIYTSIVLAITSLLTAWCAYQASAWSSNQATAAQAAGRLRTEATVASTRAGQMSIVDVMTFTNWLNATNAQDTELADFYRARFTNAFLPAFEAWLATKPLENPDAPKSPFAMEEYQQSEFSKAIELERQANAQGEAFAIANATSTAYVRNTVLFATTLFLCSMAGRFDGRAIKLGLLGLGTFLMLAGLINAVVMERAW